MALFVTVHLIPGIRFDGTPGQLALLAAIFGVLNLVLRPILTLLTCPLLLLTLGAFALAINGILLWVTASFSDRWGLGLAVDGPMAAFLGGLMMGFVQVLVQLLLRPDPRRADDAD